MLNSFKHKLEEDSSFLLQCLGLHITSFSFFKPQEFSSTYYIDGIVSEAQGKDQSGMQWVP